MSKYERLFEYVAARNEDRLEMGFAEIAEAAGEPLGHLFLKSKKEMGPMDFM